MPAAVFFRRTHGNTFTVSSHRLSCYFGNAAVDFSEPFHQYASKHGKSSQACALDRANAAYEVLAGDSSPPAGVAALVGFFIDCHIPAIRFCGTVCALYRKGLQPEAMHAFPQTSYPANTMGAVVAKTWHSHAHHEVSDVLVKLLRKGGPSPSSVRYVSGLLKRCTTNRTSEHVMRNMYTSALLGGYMHSTAIAPVAERVAVYAADSMALLASACADKSTRDMHAMVATFVCANTLQNDALRTSISTSDEQHALDTINGLANSPMSRRIRPNVSSSYSVFAVMLKALSVSCSVVTAHTALYGHAATRRVETIALSPNGFYLSTASLQQLGLNTAECCAVTHCFSNVGFTSLKMLRHNLKGLSPASRQAVSLCMWFMQKSLQLSVRKLHPVVQALQARHLFAVHGTRTSTATMCHHCATIKMQVRGISTAKTKTGVSVNPDTDAVECNACQSTSVSHVDLLGNAVRIQHRGALKTVLLCSRCVVPTCEFTYLGVFPVCVSCKKHGLQELLAPRRCICRRDAVARCGWYPVVDSGVVSAAGMCAAHMHLVPDTAVNYADMIHQFESAGKM